MKEGTVMYVVKEPREKTFETEKKTIWNQIGVLFANKGEDSFDIRLDAHPIGDRLKAFRVQKGASDDAFFKDGSHPGA